MFDAIEMAWLREVYHTGNRWQRRAALDAVLDHFLAVQATLRAAPRWEESAR